MSKAEKQPERLLTLPKDFTFDEAAALLEHFGFERFNRGKTSGSAVAFLHGSNKIKLHRPHPGNVLKPYQVQDLIDKLKGVGIV